MSYLLMKSRSRSGKGSRKPTAKGRTSRPLSRNSGNNLFSHSSSIVTAGDGQVQIMQSNKSQNVRHSQKCEKNINKVQNERTTQKQIVRQQMGQQKHDTIVSMDEGEKRVDLICFFCMTIW